MGCAVLAGAEVRQPTPPPRNQYDNRDDWEDAWAAYLQRMDDYEEWADREFDRRRDEAMEEREE